MLTPNWILKLQFTSDTGGPEGISSFMAMDKRLSVMYIP